MMTGTAGLARFHPEHVELACIRLLVSGCNLRMSSLSNLCHHREVPISEHLLPCIDLRDVPSCPSPQVKPTDITAFLDAVKCHLQFAAITETPNFAKTMLI